MKEHLPLLIASFARRVRNGISVIDALYGAATDHASELSLLEAMNEPVWSNERLGETESAPVTLCEFFEQLDSTQERWANEVKNTAAAKENTNNA